MRVGDFKGNWISKLAQSAARSFKSTEKYIYINCLVQFTFSNFLALIYQTGAPDLLQYHNHH